jgi:hypothetical protein
MGSGWTWTRGRVLTAVAVAAMVAMWVYVLYLAFVPGRQPPPDRLADPAFARAAQEVCSDALDEVAALPGALEAESASQRAEIVEEANARFVSMVDELEPLTPGGEDGEIVAEWLADWRTYLRDRASYAEALRSDPRANLFVTAKDREQVTEYIDAFAADNRMPACGTPIDV